MAADRKRFLIRPSRLDALREYAEAEGKSMSEALGELIRPIATMEETPAPERRETRTGRAIWWDTENLHDRFAEVARIHNTSMAEIVEREIERKIMKRGA